MKTSKKQAAEPANAQTAKDLANITLRPSVNAAAVILEYGKPFGNQDINELIEIISRDIKKINAGDMSRAEGMLMAQAEALQSIFTTMSLRAMGQEYMKNMETYLRLALKAQSQCRATLETLSNIKNPPVIYANQANITNGAQQINNGIPVTHAEKIKNHSNELLEAQHGGETLDSRATKAAIGKNPALEAVG